MIAGPFLGVDDDRVGENGFGMFAISVLLIHHRNVFFHNRRWLAE